MVIEKVHGLHSTGISLSDRFSILASAPAVPPRARSQRPRTRRHSAGGFLNAIGSLLAHDGVNNRNLVDQMARRLEMQYRRRELRQRLGNAGLRRAGSETNMPGLRHANSFSNLSQASFRSHNSWRGSNGNLSRSASFGNLSGRGRGRLRGLARRGGANQQLRGRFGVRQGRITRASVQQQGAARRGGARGRGARGAGRGQGTPRAQGAQGAARARGRGGLRGRGRGGVNRQDQRPVPSREELDNQLDEYMASSKSALDRDLDAYMKSAMEMDSEL
ncbi:chromatin target of PRMT1 protein isoform X2 [Plutella xylostella]|uniref:chromatin target of PRMT1 protein isoform X2 n=1 Tax=Plutella xylostella TaxID=51655 RepID=UPI00203221B5|nr:chromatin target of PRMT1 protein isoform X2 [Plutella xylostella]